MIRVWRSPDGTAIRYQPGEVDLYLEILETHAGESEVPDVPDDWKELA